MHTPHITHGHVTCFTHHYSRKFILLVQQLILSIIKNYSIDRSTNQPWMGSVTCDVSFFSLSKFSKNFTFQTWYFLSRLSVRQFFWGDELALRVTVGGWISSWMNIGWDEIQDSRQVSDFKRYFFFVTCVVHRLCTYRIVSIIMHFYPFLLEFIIIICNSTNFVNLYFPRTLNLDFFLRIFHIVLLSLEFFYLSRLLVSRVL